MKSSPPAQFVLLDHIRWFAGMLVALSHIKSYVIEDYPGGGSILTRSFYFISGFGHAAVVVLFVLSGFLIGGKLLDISSSKGGEKLISRFLVDRFARIFIVWWPALFFAAIVVMSLAAMSVKVPIVSDAYWTTGWRGSIFQDNQPKVWILNLLGLNEFLGSSVISNGPVWSLAYEWYYYLASAAALATMFRQARSHSWLIGYIFAMTTLAVFGRIEIILMGLCWLFGFMGRYYHRHDHFVSRNTFWTSVVVVLSALINIRILPGLFADYFLASSFSFMFAHKNWDAFAMAPKAGRYLSGFSFSLYLTHAPLLYAVVYCLQRNDFILTRISLSPESFLLIVAILIFSLLFARMFAFFTEDQTQAFRRNLTAFIGHFGRR